MTKLLQKNAFKTFKNNFSKSLHKKFISKHLRIKALVAFLVIFVATPLTSQAMPFFSKNKLPTTPYALQIDISKKGNKAEVDLRIKLDEERKELEPKIVAFELKFLWSDPRNDSNSKYYKGFWRRNFGEIGMFEKYFRKYTKEEVDEIWRDSERLTKLLGGGIWIDDGTKYGKRINHLAAPIPNIRLTIISLDGPDKKVVYDEVLEVKKHPENAGYFDKFLEYIKIIPGNYKIIAEVQSDALEFEGTEVLLLIGSQRAWWK